MAFTDPFTTRPPYAGSGTLGTTPSNVTLPTVQTVPVAPNVTLDDGTGQAFNTPELPTSLDNEDTWYFPTCSGVYGLPLQWKISDMPPQGSGYAQAIKLIDKVSSNSKSNPQAIGANGVEIIVQFFPNTSGAYSLVQAVMSCNVALYTYDPITSVSTEVFSATGVTPGDDVNQLYAGNLEGIDLGGMPLQVGVSNVVGGSVSVYVIPN